MRRTSLLPLAVVLAAGLLLADRGYASECRVHRSGFVSVIPVLGSACADPPLSRVARDGMPGAPATGDGLGARGGRRMATAISAAVATAGFPLLLAIRRSSPASAALAAYYGAVAILMLLAVAGPSGAGFERVELFGLLLAPAALAHLAMTFPSVPPLLERAPALARLPYFAAAGLGFVGLRALEVDTLLWPAFCVLALSAAALALGLLVFRCHLALRESQVPLERLRSAAVLVGIFLAALPAALLLPEASGPGRARLAPLVLCGLALAPLPIGLALSGYDLFDWRLDVERIRVRGLIALLAGGAAVGLFLVVRALADVPWSFQSGMLLAATTAACVSFTDGAGRRLLPRVGRERRLAERLSAYGQEIAELREEAGVAECLGRLARDALPAPRGAVFSLEEDPPRLLASWGDAAPRAPVLATSARRWLGAAHSCAMWQCGEAERARETQLLDAGVELASVLRCRGESVGLLLAGADARARPTRAELAVIAAGAAQAGVALSNARLAAAWAEAQRRAATGRAALTLAHDLHKELAWIRRLAGKLPTRLAEPQRLVRDAARIEALATERAEALRDFVRGSLRAEPAPPISLRACLVRGTRAAASRVPEIRSRCVIEDSASTLACDPRLADVVADLVDNAARASRRGQLVVVHASRVDACLALCVRDRGGGLPAGIRLFEAGQTTRADGCGVGLALAREVVASLGGSLVLGPAVGGGTRACVELPVAAGVAA